MTVVYTIGDSLRDLLGRILSERYISDNWSLKN